ncbi:hypothetical protein M5E87_08925 [Flavonifractor plautii]|nr:hypothetical protein M5E87_08925 [Flavonifractor plautii]
MVDALLDQRSELAAAVEQGTLTRDAITAAVQVDNFTARRRGMCSGSRAAPCPP